jgi:Predicted permease
VVLSGAITALVPPGWLARTLPKRPLVAVPAAGLAGVALPGCECGAVPIAGRLTARGAAPAAAFAFMLAAPAIKVVIHGDPVPRAPDTWLEVEGRWRQRTGGGPDQPSSGTPLLLAESIRVIEQPSPPYERGFPF